jgi:tripartite-type tricarboxylate transporter receptor subunit TctC
MRFQFSVSVLTSLAALMALPVAAQTYPTKPIRILIAQAPGSATDNVSRVLTAKLAGQMGQQFIIEARPGAGGAVGTEAAARAPADGYTLFMANNSTHGSNPAVYKKLPYDAIKDFSPIILIASTPYVLTAHPSLPVKNVKELVALAKKRPGDLNYGSAGNGSTHHLSGELLNMMAGIKLVHVPYKGTTPALTGLLSGEVSVMFFTVVGIEPHAKSGKARVLAVTTPKRAPLMPELPTMIEAGYPGFEVTSWFGLLAPAGTPPAVIERLRTEMARVLNAPETRNKLAEMGMNTLNLGPKEFQDFLGQEIRKWGPVIRSAQIKVE